MGLTKYLGAFTRPRASLSGGDSGLLQVCHPLPKSRLDIAPTWAAAVGLVARSVASAQALQDLTHLLPGVRNRSPEEAGEATEEPDSGKHRQNNAEQELDRVQ